MTPDPINYLPAPGNCIRVVYSLNGLEMFAIGALVRSGLGQITIEQYSDQYGPVEPFHLTIQWSSIIRFTMNGPAAGNPAGRPSAA